MTRIRIEIRITESKPDDAALVNLIVDLKRRRALSQVVREGIWLITDLRAGRTDVLFNLFPHLQRQLVQDTVQDNLPFKPVFNTQMLDKLAAIAVEMMRPAAFFNRPY